MDFSEINFTDHLQELADVLTSDEIQVLSYLKSSEHLTKVRTRMEEQVLKTEALLSQYSKYQYVEQRITVMDGLVATFRTLPPWSQDEALGFASSSEFKNNAQRERALSRRRLSHGLILVNDEAVAGVALEGSYAEMSRASREKFTEALTSYADGVYEFLLFYGLAEKIAESFAVWESVVWNRLNGIDDLTGAIKKSTRIPTKEQ